MILKQRIICVWILVTRHSKQKLAYMDAIMVEEINCGIMIMYII